MVMTSRSPYGGVRPLRMAAPEAPRVDTAQGRANTGQMVLPEKLTMQAQQTMQVPATPVKGLLASAAGRANNQRAMSQMPGLPGRARYV